MKAFLITVASVIAAVIVTWLSFWIYAILASRRDYNRHVNKGGRT
jgi:hypothetical protein